MVVSTNSRLPEVESSEASVGFQSLPENSRSNSEGKAASVFHTTFDGKQNRDVACEIAGYLEGKSLTSLAQTGKSGKDIVQERMRIDQAQLVNSELIEKNSKLKESWEKESSIGTSSGFFSSDRQGVTRWGLATAERDFNELKKVPYHRKYLGTILMENKTIKEAFSTISFWLKVIEKPEFRQYKKRLQSGINIISKLPISKRSDACNKLMKRFFAKYPTIAPRITSLDLRYASLYCTKPEWFKHFPNLNEVNLKNNKTKEIPLRTFRHNSHLQKVFIYNVPKAIIEGVALGTALGFVDYAINTERSECTSSLVAGSVLGSMAGLANVVRKVEPTATDTIRRTTNLIKGSFKQFFWHTLVSSAVDRLLGDFYDSNTLYYSMYISPFFGLRAVNNELLELTIAQREADRTR